MTIWQVPRVSYEGLQKGGLKNWHRTETSPPPLDAVKDVVVAAAACIEKEAR